jgi:flagellar basal body-associated protein FliL
LGERLVRNEEVSGSIPLSSTMRRMPYRNGPFTALRAFWGMSISLLRAAFAALALTALVSSAPLTHASGGGGGEQGEKKEGAKAKAPKKARAITSLRSWVSVDSFTVAIIQEGRLRGRFTVSFGMDVPDKTLHDKAEELMPRLRDAWLNDLVLYAATTLRPKRAADVPGISEMLQRGADRVLGKPGSVVLMAQARVDMHP